MGQTEGDIDKEEDTSVSISADSTSMFTSEMTLMISTSNPGLSAVSIHSKLIHIELKRIRNLFYIGLFIMLILFGVCK